MIEAEIRKRGRFTEFLDGLRTVFRRKGAEAAAEIGEMERPEPRDEAEEALYLAMGWAEPEGDDALKVMRGKLKEAVEA